MDSSMKLKNERCQNKGLYTKCLFDPDVRIGVSFCFKREDTDNFFFYGFFANRSFCDGI